MKKKNVFLLIFVVFSLLSCKKNDSFVPSTKEIFESLPAAHQLPFGTVNDNINFFQKNVDSSYGMFLFFDGDAQTIQLVDITKISWAKGSKNICCICQYGGSVLPGGIKLSIYDKNSMKLLESPAEDLIFVDAKINKETVFLELLSTRNYLDNLDSNGKLINPENVKRYYGRYVISSGKLTVDE